MQWFPAGLTDIEPSGLDSRSRALNPPLLWVHRLQPSQLLNTPLSRNLEGPTTLLWLKLSGPTNIEPRGLDIRFRASNRLPSCVPGHKPPNLQLTTRPQTTTPPHRIQIEYHRSHRHRAQGARCPVPRAKLGPLRLPSYKHPRISIQPSPASYKHPPPYSGRIWQVPPTSSPGGSTFGFVRQIVIPLCVSGYEPPSS
jgi:hypothetical protein